MVSSDSDLSGIEVGVAALNGFKNCKKFITSSTVIAFGFTEGMGVVGNDSFSTVTHLRKSRSDTKIASPCFVTVKTSFRICMSGMGSMVNKRYFIYRKNST